MPFNFIKSIFPAQPSPGNGRSVPEQPPQRTRRSPKEYEARVTKSRRASGTSQSSPSSLSEEESPEEPHSLRRRLSSYNPDEEEGWGVGTTVATVLEEPAPPRVRAPKTPPRTVIMQPSTVPTGGKGGQTVSPEGRRKIRERWAKKVDEIKENAVRNAIVEADNLGVSAEDREQGVREIKSSIEAASGQSQYQKGQQPKPITNQSKMPLGNRKPRPAPRPPKVKKRVVKPDEEKSEWELRPHELAQKMFKEHAGDAKRVAEAIKASLAADGIAHPEYALRDVELRNAHWQLINLVEAFSEEYFDFQFDDTESLTERLAEFAPETVRIIGCVASGGPGGPGGWHQMFTYAPKRRALVCAIIGNVIFEQVYQHLFFGGHRSQLEELGRVQKQMANADGFDRNRKYAEIIFGALEGRANGEITLPYYFHDHVNEILIALLTHLEPIMTLSPKVKSNSTRHYKAIGRDLYNIIVKAGIISLIMRCDPHTIYHFPHSFKETVFDGRTMEVVNFEDMQAEDPRSRKSWPQGYTKDDKDTARNYSPLTQIILMDGIEAYRRGGWETADSTRWSPEYAQGTENEGFRVRRIVPAWTYLRWGKPRRFERGVEIANEKIHGKDWNGGFVEFQDVEGVPKPRPVVENDGDSS